MHIREATPDDAPGIARVHVATWRTAYSGIVPAEHLAGLSYERSEARWHENLAGQGDGRFTLVAEVDGAIAGFASGGPGRDDAPGYQGELYGLYILVAYQRHGIGRALMLTAARRLAADGCKAMIIWVLKDNLQARAFYEALGGVPLSEKTITVGGAELIDMAYGWPDIRSLTHGEARPM
ncbi:MAG: GNAT family N-acetyltransferase [Anaerolineae bacterium]|jgi:ribosomal protein S18 acetylase RimI-like enzyme|nr:GNAT family N-acetyltransferase [Anaerolineae bacterium]